MNKNKGSVASTPGLTNLGNQLRMKNNSLYQNKLQHSSRRMRLESTELSRQPESPFMAFVCDECAAPLHLYGENFFESYSAGRACFLRCLCDIHAAELEVNA